MSQDTLVVFLDGSRAGALTRSGVSLRFEYDASYPLEATPLSVSMPVAVRAHTNATVTPWLQGLLPDNEEVLRRWARRFDVSLASPFHLLGTPLGEDCAGGVQFAPPEREAAVAAGVGELRPLSAADIAGRLAGLRADAAGWLGPSFTGQWSLAGAQAKIALREDDGWFEPAGAEPTSHILKPASVLDAHDLNEYLCLAAARSAGLRVVTARFLRFEDETALVVERFDRYRDQGRLRRVHQEDIAQALSVPPDRKYEADGGPGVADVVGLFIRTMPAPVAGDAVHRFVDALAWNWLIGNTDAHAKNYSLLLAGRDVRFAPLYDVASLLPYPGVFVPKLKMAMKLAGRYDLRGHSKQTWERVARTCQLTPDAVVERVAELAAAAAGAFAAAVDGAASDLTPAHRDFAWRLSTAVAERAAACRELLSA
jgi:serine/threonine-protein kinase HipA